MDVRCPSCGTDFELDDARVPDTGLPVKCSRCGHVFRAVRPPPGAPEPSKIVAGVHAATAEWMIRKANGETIRFRELTTLQRWIVERKVSRTDEISKTGKKWEKLGNIPELVIFFQVIESREPESEPQVTPAALSDAVAELQAAQANAGAAPASPAPKEERSHKSWPVDRPWSPLRATTPPPPPTPTDHGRPAAPPRTGPDPLSETLPDPTELHPSLARTTLNTTQPLEAGEQRYETVRWDLAPNLPDDVREEYEIGSGRPGHSELAARRVRPRHVAGIALTLVAAILAVTYVLRPAWLTATVRHYIAGVPPEAVRSVDDAYAALLVDTAASIDTAIAKLEAAVGLDGSYAAARAAHAEALAARADLNRDLADFRAAGLSAQPVAEPAPELAAVTELRAKADADLGTARTAARQALDVDAMGIASNRAMLEVLRLSGDTSRASELAASIRAQLPDDARLVMATAAMALAEPAAAESAQQSLETLLAREPRANHARYLLARLLVARGKKDEAATAIAELLTTTPTHERALALQKTLASPASPPQPQVGTATPPDAKGTTPTSAEPTGAEAPPATPPSAAPGTPEPGGTTTTPVAATTPAGPKSADDPTLTFAEALARGERLRSQDRTSQAVRYYERAAVLEPNDADAFLGVGYCRLDLGETSAAIAAFRRAIELSPRFTDAHFGIAEAYRIRGNKLFAIRSYKQYLDIAPHGADAEVARAHLQELEDDNSAPTPQSPAPDQPTPPPPPGQ